MSFKLLVGWLSVSVQNYAMTSSLIKEGMMLNLSGLCYVSIWWKTGSPSVFSKVTQHYSPQMIGLLWAAFLLTASSYHLLVILSCSVCMNCRKCNGCWPRSHLKLYTVINSVLRMFWLVLSSDLIKDRHIDDDSARFEFESEPITICQFLKKPTNLLHFA